jgi:hypothetical protein
MKRSIALGIAAIALALPVKAFANQTFPGNGDTGFGGAIGQGSLSLSDNGTTVSGNFTRGGGNFDNVLVIYIDSVPGGFSDTSLFNDANDGLRRGISGFDGGTNRSVLTFPAGFSPDYALAIGPAGSENFGGLWGLVAGGNNSLDFKQSANVSNLGNISASNYTFDFNLSNIGLTPNAGQSFTMLGTYISNSGYRSTEAIAGNTSGTQGWNAFTGTASTPYFTPEPGSIAFLGLAAFTGLNARRRRN